jgi:hypothetical protein
MHTWRSGCIIRFTSQGDYLTDMTTFGLLWSEAALASYQQL